MTSLILPTAYLGGCIAAMSIFSHIYRRAKNAKTIEPWFPENKEKEQYIALLNAEPETAEHHLKAALLRRAMEALGRLTVIQDERSGLAELVRSGYISDDIWRDFEVAQEETVAEIREVMEEANTYTDEWGKTIFQTARQMRASEKQKVDKKEVELMREREEKRWAMELQSEQLEEDMKKKNKKQEN